MESVDSHVNDSSVPGRWHLYYRPSEFAPGDSSHDGRGGWEGEDQSYRYSEHHLTKSSLVSGVGAFC